MIIDLVLQIIHILFNEYIYTYSSNIFIFTKLVY